jgi:hypothetical protein
MDIEIVLAEGFEIGQVFVGLGKPRTVVRSQNSCYPSTLL